MNIMRKTYLNPETQVTAMMPQSIICASGPGQLSNSGSGTDAIQPPVTNVPGGFLGD